MFTGIISDVGVIENRSELSHGLRFRMTTSYDPSTIAIGASIACAGTCLTVVELPQAGSTDRWFDVEAWEEALRLTTVGSWVEGTRINLERALKVGDELGGHIVSGHVDGTAQIIEITDEGAASRFRIRAPHDLAMYIAPKGSVALDGTSLTVNQVERDEFDVLIIRHTLEVTTWGTRKSGDILNFEVDTMARYAARLAQASKEA